MKRCPLSDHKYFNTHPQCWRHTCIRDFVTQNLALEQQQSLSYTDLWNDCTTCYPKKILRKLAYVQVFRFERKTPWGKIIRYWTTSARNDLTAFQDFLRVSCRVVLCTCWCQLHIKNWAKLLLFYLLKYKNTVIDKI